MEHKYRIELSEGGVYAVSVGGYKLHEPPFSELFPDAELIGAFPFSTCYLRKLEKAHASFSEGRIRFTIVEKGGKKWAQPFPTGNHRKCYIDVAGGRTEDALGLLDEMVERVGDMIEFDQRTVMPLSLIERRMKETVDEFRAENSQAS